MKTALIAIFLAVLVVGLQNIGATSATTPVITIGASGGSSSSGGSEEVCPSFKGGDKGGPPILVDASSTGSIHATSEHVHQSFDEECHSQEGRQYRTANGVCNSVFNLGNSKTPFKRLLPAEYSDGLSSPRSYGQNGALLPSAADVSWMVNSHKDAIDQLTTMFMQWGQFIDHDITLTPAVVTKVKCCGVNHTYPDFMNHPQCYPIRLGSHDANKRFVGNCMEMTRSLPARDAHGHQITPREQLNEVTSFVDASMVYGSNAAHTAKLREKNDDGTLGAKMRTSGANLLPKADEPSCILKPGHYCFLAGDPRVNVQPGLIVMQTIFVRLHNLLADGLRAQKPHATDEQIFQEARKIVIAMVQMINYAEWLPLVLGDKLMDHYHLRTGRKTKKSSGRIRYSPFMDPRMTNSFSTAAFRFGHSIIPEHLVVSGVAHEFRDLFFRPHLAFTDFDGVLESLVNSSRVSRSQDSDRFMVDDLTSHLFEPADQVKGQPSKGLDIAALNIQRGRDHGLPPFNKFRQCCGLSPIKSFDEFDTKVATKLRKLYSSVEDIDLFVGGLLESVHTTSAVGGKLPIGKRPYVGPTFACIIAQQFQALKFGDRFYFETDRDIEGFTDAQLSAIRQVTLGKVACVTSNLTQVPENVFIASKKATLDCSAVKNNFLDFSLWKA